MVDDISADGAARRKLEEERISFIRACCIRRMGDGVVYAGGWQVHLVRDSNKLWEEIEKTRKK